MIIKSPVDNQNRSMIRSINEKPISFIVFIITIFIFLVSCERDDHGKIPFGYDPGFNYLAVLKSIPVDA